MNRISFLFVLGVVVVLILGGIVGYAKFSEAGLNEDAKRYDLQIANLENDVVIYEGGNVEAALSAKEALDFLKGDSVKWSKVIEAILATTPKKADTKLPLVDYTSYSGSQGNRLSISMRTNPKSETPYYDVAELIKAFSESGKFKNAFVPAISPGFTAEGDVVLTFNFNVEYVGGQEQTPEVEPKIDLPADVPVPKFSPIKN